MFSSQRLGFNIFLYTLCLEKNIEGYVILNLLYFNLISCIILGIDDPLITSQLGELTLRKGFCRHSGATSVDGR